LLKSILEDEVDGRPDEEERDAGNRFYRTFSSMRTICTEEILTPLHNTPNASLDKQIIRVFQSNWATFEDQITDLSNTPDVGNNPTLQAQLNFFVSLKAITSMYSPNPSTIICERPSPKWTSWKAA
jgi:hypothetical protein